MATINSSTKIASPSSSIPLSPSIPSDMPKFSQFTPESSLTPPSSASSKFFDLSENGKLFAERRRNSKNDFLDLDEQNYLSSVASTDSDDEAFRLKSTTKPFKAVSGLTQQLRTFSDPGKLTVYPNPVKPIMPPSFQSFRFLNFVQYPIIIAKQEDHTIVFLNEAAKRFFGSGLNLNAVKLVDLFPRLKKKFKLSHRKHPSSEIPSSVGSSSSFPSSIYIRRASDPLNAVVSDKLNVGSAGDVTTSKAIRAKLANGSFVWVELTLNEWKMDDFSNDLENEACDKYELATFREISKVFGSRYKDEFDEIKLLGKGGHGIVYKARNKLDGEDYAVKKVFLKVDANAITPGKFVQEVQTFAKISNHPNIIRYYSAWTEPCDLDEENDDDESDYSSDDESGGDLFNQSGLFLDNSVSEQMRFLTSSSLSDFSHKQAKSLRSKKKASAILYIQMQLCLHQDLRRWIESKKENFNLQEVLAVFRQIVAAVSYIHDKGFCHGDLKPDNIFIQDDDHVLVGDFGLSRSVMSKLANVYEVAEHGTYLYSAPESRMGVKGDIFSLGVILIELLVPFSTAMERAIVLSNVKHGAFPVELDKFGREGKLAKELLSVQPKARPSADSVLSIVESWIFGDNTPASSLDRSSRNLYVKTGLVCHAPNTACILKTSDGMLTDSSNRRWSSEELMLSASGKSGFCSQNFIDNSKCVASMFATPFASPLICMDEVMDSKSDSKDNKKIIELQDEVDHLKAEIERLKGLLSEKEAKNRNETQKRSNTSLRLSTRNLLF